MHIYIEGEREIPVVTEQRICKPVARIIISVRVIVNVLKNQNVVQLHVHIYIYIYIVLKETLSTVDILYLGVVVKI